MTNYPLLITMLTTHMSKGDIAYRCECHPNTIGKVMTGRISRQKTRDKLKYLAWEHLPPDQLDRCGMDVEAHRKRTTRADILDALMAESERVGR